MKLSDLKYDFPERLVATEPKRPSRVMYIENDVPKELTIQELLQEFNPGDILVINDTKVSKRRVFSDEGLEILFLDQITEFEWKVLFPASRLKRNQSLNLPGNIKMHLKQQGLPQVVELSGLIDDSYFEEFGEYPLPPYIQKSRNQRHNKSEDENWYQTHWANKTGSQAAPTASLHFTLEDLEFLKNRGVEVLTITLHVGIGTFLPIKVESLSEHKMHAEKVFVEKDVAVKIMKAKNNKVWAMGTTVARTLEALAQDKIPKDCDGNYFGETDIFIWGDYNWKVVDRLLTNFHQPETTLLALVASFSTLEIVKKNYQWAIEKNFRLFSYGDLTVWKR